MRKEGKRTLVVGLIAGALGLLGTGKLAQKVAGNGQERTRRSLLGLGEARLLDASWDLKRTDNDAVHFFTTYLSGEKRDEMREYLERTGRYGPMILEALEERGMPKDLIYLAMIESGFDPNAYSVAHAVGIWQFIAETGRRYGLEVSTYVDERRDPVKATAAALDYLEELYERFGSWYLAAAAYNTGENRVDRILAERAGGQRGDDDLYWVISPFIPRETRDYVPLMLAAANIGKDPARYGFTGLRWQEPLDYDEVRVPAGTPLDRVARAAGVGADAVLELNPHLVRQVTPPDRAWDVRVPTGTEGTFAANFEGGTGAA